MTDWYMVIQDHVIWCTTDSLDFLRGFCQYLLDSARESGLHGFQIVHVDDQHTQWIPLLDFCEAQEIRKRTFEERMEGSEIDRKMMQAWADALKTYTD